MKRTQEEFWNSLDIDTQRYLLDLFYQNNSLTNNEHLYLKEDKIKEAIQILFGNITQYPFTNTRYKDFRVGDYVQYKGSNRTKYLIEGINNSYIIKLKDHGWITISDIIPYNRYFKIGDNKFIMDKSELILIKKPKNII